MNPRGKRPGPLWMFFYGRPRRGFPWLLAGLAAAIVVLSLTFAIPGGPDLWRSLAPVLLVLLTVGVIVAVVAMGRSRRRR